MLRCAPQHHKRGASKTFVVSSDDGIKWLQWPKLSSGFPYQYWFVC